MIYWKEIKIDLFAKNADVVQKLFVSETKLVEK